MFVQISILLLIIVLQLSMRTCAFVGPRPAQRPCFTPIFASNDSNLPDIASMKAGEMRKELESYGISTKSFLEKKDFAEALEKARAEGRKPINGGSSAPNGSSDASSREDRYQHATEKARAMKTGELKRELQAMGVDCKSFFEKSEFVKAYAEAVADGKTATGKTPREEHPFDPSYRDVVMQKMQPRDKQIFGSTIIDVTSRL